MTKITKTIWTFTLLHPSDETPHCIEDALEMADQGNGVGDVTGVQSEEVEDDQVEEELQKLGNDGEFFNLELDQ